jgi:glycosyltransferase involved in cell wall biosynthesis
MVCMNIWLLSYLAPPQLNAESILVAKTIRHLLQQSQRLTLLTSKLDPDFKVDPQLEEYMGKDLTIERFSNGYPSWKVTRRIIQRTLQSVAGDPQNIWTKAVCQWSDVQRKKERELPDLLYSRSQPGCSHIAALHIKRRFDIPWVAQFNDPWAHNPYHPLHNADKDKRIYLERQVMETVDHVIFPTQEMANLYMELYPRLRQRVTVLPHHFDPELYQTKSTAGKSVKSKTKRIRMAYLGDFYGIRSPEPLLKALEIAETEMPELAERIEIVFVGNVEQRYQEMIKEYQTRIQTIVNRKPQVLYFESLRMMARMDMLLLIDAPSDENIFLSSKLIDYLGARRPILGITSEKGTASAILRHYQYPVADPRDPQAIASALVDMVRNEERYQEQARSQDIEAYASPVVTKKLIDIFESVCQQSHE